MNYSETQSELSVADFNQYDSREHFLQDLDAKLTLLTESKESIESTSDLIAKRLAVEAEIAS